jgi:hypothetical protein
MRLIHSVAMLASTLVAAGKAEAQTELRASVDLSEWTPSQNLVLNLSTGIYVVTPPTEGWPEARPQPFARQGRLAGDSLRMTRALAEQAFKSGLTDKECEARKRPGDDIVIYNAVGPMELMLTDGRVTQTSAQNTCRAGAATALFSYITRLFDHRSP